MRAIFCSLFRLLRLGWTLATRLWSPDCTVIHCLPKATPILFMNLRTKEARMKAFELWLAVSFLWVVWLPCTTHADNSVVSQQAVLTISGNNDFGNALVGAPVAVHQFRLANTSEYPARFIMSSTRHPFSIEQSSCRPNQIILPQGYCTFRVKVETTERGKFERSLTVEYTALGQQDDLRLSLPLKLRVHPPDTLASPASVNFGTSASSGPSNGY